MDNQVNDEKQPLTKAVDGIVTTSKSTTTTTTTSNSSSNNNKKFNAYSNNRYSTAVSSSSSFTRLAIFKLTLVNICGGLTFGYNTGVIAGVLNLDQWKSESEVDRGLLTCSILIGAMFGSIIGGIVIERLGRKLPILFVAVLTIIGALGSSFVPPLWPLLIFRVILGLGVGICGVVCPTYVSEMATPEKKGSLGTLFQIAITVGIFVSDVLGFAFKSAIYNYRWMFGFGAIPGALLLITYFFVPESSKWIQKKSQQRNSFLLVNSKNSRNEMGLKVLLSKSIGRFSLFIGVVLAINNQLTGINAFMFFSPSIFESAGITNGNSPMIATIFLVGWNVITTLISTFLIDRIGRRKLMLIGTLVMSTSCIILAILNLLIKGTALGVMSIILLFIFIAGFEASAGPLFWILVIEIFPVEMREIGSSILNAIQWIFNITLSFSFLSLVSLIGQSAIFFIFGGFGVLCLIFMYIYLPETKQDDDDDDDDR
ncbi:hypothetical protein CYY_005789 [Polysphondylium violaceum]|uniref:Major facilitator superfamily (MFS) profile domain-containing protein n=1 Tax=Polysphondylium violaceum TaxID=133409 RepID=A0A8J4PVM2_9MYCE|nr:hypothetical protein CYY_005789 [Polysphondylium violaceum]